MAFTLLKLSTFPPHNIYIGRRKLAAIGALSKGMVGEHLTHLQRPWRWGDQWYPPLFFTRRGWARTAKRELTYFVPNEAGWQALFSVMFRQCEDRKQAAHQEAEDLKQRQREAAARARAVRTIHLDRRPPLIPDPLALAEAPATAPSPRALKAPGKSGRAKKTARLKQPGKPKARPR